MWITSAMTPGYYFTADIEKNYVCFIHYIAVNIYVEQYLRIDIRQICIHLSASFLRTRLSLRFVTLCEISLNVLSKVSLKQGQHCYVDNSVQFSKSGNVSRKISLIRFHVKLGSFSYQGLTQNLLHSSK